VRLTPVLAVVWGREIRPVCDLGATAVAAVSCYGGVRLDSGTGDDGAGGERRQAVLAEAFRMVGSDRQRGTLRIPNAAFLKGEAAN